MNIRDGGRFIDLFAGSGGLAVGFRLIHETDKTMPVIKLFGTLQERLAEIERAQSEGYGVFVVVNDGGNRDAEITRIRAHFIDADGVPLPARWHLQPDFIVQRDELHWHAYWLASDIPVKDFRDIQRCLAAHYGTDPAVCNPSRVMRLAGSLHLKGGAPGIPVRLIDHTNGADAWELGHTAAQILAGLGEAVPQRQATGGALAGEPLTPDQLAGMLAVLDPDCPRGEWRDIAAALHATPCTDPDFDKGALFVAWSRGDVRNV